MPIFTDIPVRLKKIFKITGYTILLLISVLLLTAILVNIPVVQNWLIRQVTQRLSKDLNTTVKVKHINLDLAMFNKMSLEGTFVADHRKDTLLYAGKVNVRLTDWFFLQDKIVLKHIGLEDAFVNMHRVDSVWNYQFLIDYFSGPSSGKKKKSIDLDLKVVSLSNIHFLKKDEWRGQDMWFHVGSLNVDARQISFSEKNININHISLKDPLFSMYNYAGRRPKLPVPSTEPLPVQDTALQWNPDEWNLVVDMFTITNGIVKSSRESNRAVYYYFDGQNVTFSNINSSFKNLRLNKDTVIADLALSAVERSGFEIKSLTSKFKMQPRGMQFADLDIRTAKSRLGNYFALSYDDFDDMSDFIEKVKMDGVFQNSEVESDDIAFFAPAVASWKKRIRISGAVKGTVSNLSAKNISVNAGSNTLLTGDLKMVGLPDINKTFVDLKANSFKTTYADAVAFIPQLKKITEPRIDRLKYLHFNGYFTGFLNDFVTSGTLKTDLGTIVSDVNMRMPGQGVAGYSGKLTTSDFNIASLLDNKQLGRISFNGKIKGSGFNLKNLQAGLDGEISSVDFNNYRYRNIKVKGILANKLFNGELIAKDSNLSAHLNGLINFSRSQPRFDFTALIEKSNLKKLHFYKEDIDFNGEVRFNFTGSTIDNFLGSAKVFNASVYKDGQRLSFDSLTLESSIVSSQKSIIVSSNEFDAMLTGEFTIRELPNSFQIFLNHYYPSYINPANKSLLKENFSFVVTTRNINDYLGLLSKDLVGFNNSSVSGRVNFAEDLFDVEAEVPGFSYKNISFVDIGIQGRGNLDTLSLISRIGDVLINDSLHFPGTEINIRSSHDVSDVNISTSANQTLNAANISGQVTTLKTGVSILFNQSDFDINGKKWTIDKNGKLVLSRELVTTEGLRIYNAEQEILISSVPSSITNTNDLKLDLKKINIGDFAPFFAKGIRLEGLLTGTVEVADPFGNLHVDVNAQTSYFRMDDDSLGRLQLIANYTKNSGKINTKLVSDNEDYNFEMNGLFNVLDSAKEDLDLRFKFYNTNIHPIGKYLSSVFSRLNGSASGELQIAGPAKNLKYLGAIHLKEGGLMVNYTKCYYTIPNADLTFNDGSIDFTNFVLKDSLNNTGEITKGRLDHQGFKDLAFDFRLRTNQLLLLNTGAADNNQFYGKMIGKVNLSFTGPLEDMQMDIKGEATDTSNVYLPIGSSRESGEAGFIVWKVYGREMEDQDYKFRESNFTVTLDVTANKYANIFVILDETTGDIIAAKGNGNLKLRAGTKEDMTMSGRFNIESGNYTFTFQSIKRNFKLREGAGSYISWNGNPTEATIDIEAEYEAENVRFADLLKGSSLEFAASEDVKRFRGKVLVIATLMGSLTKPDISFEIELPQNSPIRSNQDVSTILSFIENDKNELNKQVSFLILFNTFGPYTGGGARGGGTGDIANKALEGIVVNSISGFLSNILTNEFSNILQNIFKDKSLKVNINATVYSGTNLIDNYNPNQVSLPDRTNFNLSIGKSFFNERLTFVVGGALDFGLNTTQQNQSSAFPFLPDVTAEWRLTPDGKFRLTFFYRENYSYMGTGGGKQNRSGSSISFRREFDRFDELLRKKKKPVLNPQPQEPVIGSQ